MKDLKAKISDNRTVAVFIEDDRAVAYINSEWILMALKAVGFETSVIRNEIVNAYKDYILEVKNESKGIKRTTWRVPE